ncbi:type II secretion system protein GspD [Thalassotalea euphylliae]|uniref:type II secretion system protein GspD n=1 Tax=Thalassotalea euphylliae TaxID=1655234 RepID=UPI0036335BD9
MKLSSKTIVGIFFSVLVSSCAAPDASDNIIKLEQSYLIEQDKDVSSAESTTQEQGDGQSQAAQTVDTSTRKSLRFVPPLKLAESNLTSAEDILARFGVEESITVASDELPLAGFLHFVLGEQLAVNYVLSDEVNDESQNVTLNITDKVSAKKLFLLAEDVLKERDYVIKYDDNVFYIHKANKKASKGNVVYGYGKTIESVPQTSLEIIQMVPFEYGMQATLPNTLKLLLGVKSYPDQKRNTVLIKGKRKEVIRALEFVQMMDKPAIQGREIGIYEVSYLQTQDLVRKLTELLKQEGISTGSGGNTSSTLSIVELDKQGQLIFFAANTTVIERAVFWAKEVDKPVLTAEKQYFIYQPSFSRAVDLGASLQALIGSSSGVSGVTSAEREAGTGNQRQTVSASSKSMKMVIDERANAVIFFTSGSEYQQILPLIKRLDIQPKQVMLEVTIAEVTLTDTFKSGVEFVLTNQGVEKTGGFNLSSGGTGLNYVLSGTNGSLEATLFQSNENVNVLSRPSLLVRDGVTANINVGDDIPTVGEIITDPVNGSQTSVVYRKTGVELDVTPTINARGVVIMDINQKISNQSPGTDAVAGSPIVFERSIKTEVIAESGQTVVLGGLISDNKSFNDTSVPFFSSIPLIGNLFDSKNDTLTKTELVVLVTPRVIESGDEWEHVKSKFLSSLKAINF